MHITKPASPILIQEDTASTGFFFSTCCQDHQGNKGKGVSHPLYLFLAVSYLIKPTFNDRIRLGKRTRMKNMPLATAAPPSDRPFQLT